MSKMSKWEGKATTKLKCAKAQQIWPFLHDFFGLNKWFPTLTTCVAAEGVSGQPGCVRYCAGFKTHVNSGEETVNWTKQKLLTIDEDDMSFSYSIIDGNVGFSGYVSWWRVKDIDQGCEIEWKYEVEPVQGWKIEDLHHFIGSGLKGMGEKMEEAVLQSST